MYTLVAFATQWGSKHGGINSFSADLLSAFGVAYHVSAQVFCIVATATSEQIEQAAKTHVQVISLPYPTEVTSFESSHGAAGVNCLRQMNISFDPEKTVWLGHDRTTGEAAIAAAKTAGGRSAVIHHMSYDHYESYAEDSASAQQKAEVQSSILRKADLVLAVGPLLRDAAEDRLGGSKSVHMLIPGLAEIDAQDAPNTFVAFLSGRLSRDAARIKQGQLGIAAFATAHREARDETRPESLRKRPKLLLRGVDFDNRIIDPSFDFTSNLETELKQFAQTYAKAVINLHALPFTEDRTQLYSELSRSSVALMPSWHEGFGLVAWEAIAAGVPLILTTSSGVFRLLDEVYAGAATGCVYSIELDGSIDEPFFSTNDLTSTVKALKAVADNPGKARMQAGELRSMLLEKYSWAGCSEELVNILEWQIPKGSMPSDSAGHRFEPEGLKAPDFAAADEDGPLRLPVAQWRAGRGIAHSQLLRAEEGLLDFDSARDPDVEKLNAWLDDSEYPLAVRLIIGPGGQGKTRLALELCRRRRTMGWKAGLLESSLEPSAIPAAWLTLLEYQQPLFIVIDYAETRQPTLLALLNSALRKPSESPIRVLLLARDGGEWWENLPSKDPHCEALLIGYATTGPLQLPPLYPTSNDRRVAYHRALSAFAKNLEVTVPAIEPDLSGEHFERPLFVQIAALLALYGEQPTTAQGLTRTLLNHERRYWRGILARFDWPEPDRRAEQLLALTTLSGGFVTPKVAEPYWLTAKGNVITTPEFNSLFRELAALYPGTQGLQALRPDLLGEALVAQALLRTDGMSLLDAVLTSSATHLIRRNALTLVARISTQRLELQEIFVEVIARHFAHCCADIIAVSKETTSNLPALAEFAFARLTSAVKNQAAGLLAPLLSEESVQLGRLSCVVAEHRAEKSREKAREKGGKQSRVADYARALLVHAIHLNRIGLYSKACEKDREALELFRRFPAADIHRIESDYAALLTNFSYHLSQIGKYQEALPLAAESVEIYQRIAKKNLNLFEPELAAALGNYSSRLDDADLNDDAREQALKGLEIYKRLSQKSPERFQPQVAVSLSNYANRLSDAGLNVEALAHARQALEIHERLMETNPDRFEPHLARSLNNYGSLLAETGAYDDALELVRKSMEIRQRLVQKNPDRFEPDLVVSLSNYAHRLSEVGQIEYALEQARQALETGQRWAQKIQTRFDDDVLSNMCYVSFLAWAKGNKNEDSLQDVDQILALVPSSVRPLMRLFVEFVEGCWATETALREHAFQRVLIQWMELSSKNKARARPYWLCAVAWCAEFWTTDVVGVDWESEWRQFEKQRAGRIPKWMQLVAKRLEFEWPA
jgi:glycosyltransferase involved in cell wall biosynthesis/tetratricopeptide (TPR) repeat protein